MWRQALICTLAIAGRIHAVQPETKVPSGPPAEAAKAPAAVDQPVIKLLEPGTPEGRRRLRFTPTAGSEMSWEIVIRMNMTISLKKESGEEIPMPDAGKSPAIRVPMKVVIDKVDDSGDIHYTAVFEKFEAVAEEGVEPQRIEMVNAAMKQAGGMKGTVVATNRGIVKEGKFGGDNLEPSMAQLLDSMNQSIRQASLPVPEEEVGVGAKWSVIQKPRIGGFTQEITAIYTIRSMTADGVVCEVTMSQSAASQKIKLPEGAPKSDITLESLVGAGSGKVELTSDSPMPLHSSMKAEANLEMTLRDGPEPFKMKQKVVTEMTFERQKPVAK
jgi:hypothetical protein